MVHLLEQMLGRSLTLGLLLMTAAPLVRADGVADGWCVIVGSIAYERFDEAAALAARARAAGAAGAGVFDPRDFRNLAWGALAVVAVSGLPDAKAAEAAARPLRKAKLDADVKRCVPIKAPAAPVADAAHLRSRAELGTGKAKPDLAGDAFTQGCFAYSPKSGAVACVAATRTSNAGTHASVVFLGEKRPAIEIFAAAEPVDPIVKPGDALARRLEAALAAGGYVDLLVELRDLGPGDRADWVFPRFAVEWQRKVESAAGDMSGERVDDKILLRCGGRDRTPEPIAGTIHPYARNAFGFVSVIPGTHRAIITLDSTWAMEGENGRAGNFVLYDLDACAVAGTTVAP